MDDFTPIRECRFAAIDFESAGAAPGQTDFPVQIGIAEWSLDQGWGETWMSYIACDAPITWSAQRIHGITREDLRSAPTYQSLWPEIQARLAGRVLVGHNIGTEKSFLAHFPGHGFSHWVDTLQLCRQAYPSLKDHSLGALCDRLQLSSKLQARFPQGCWHDALYDAAASLALLEHLIDYYRLPDTAVQALLV